MDAALQFEVQALLASYVEAIDDNRLEDWPDFFVDECRYLVTTAENFERGLPLGLIYATSRAMLRDRVRSLRQANVYEAQRYRHVLGPPVVTQEADGSLRARSNVIVARIMHSGETTIFATGRYQDRIARDASGRLRFAEKIVILDSRQIDTLLAIPL
jgi:anthranilate 1,2-dioxygenase small subunit/terephthalate 1,2-dioxygenase oxygenase component beta subunit